MMQTRTGFEPRILMFCCNWCSYAGADLAGVSRIQYPPNIRIIRVMCSGRVEIAFILRAFLSGADGVLVTGCHIGDCHYISGNKVAEKRMETVRELLNKLGIENNRFALEWISASEGQKFADTVKEFVANVKSLGPLHTATADREDIHSLHHIHSPHQKSHTTGKGLESRAPPGRESHETCTSDLKEIVRKNQAYHCLSCGKCSGICPVTRSNPKYLPRVVVESAVLHGIDRIKNDPNLWLCLSCGKCSQVCPSNVSFSDFIKDVRAAAHACGNIGECAHLGILHDLMRLMSNEKLRQNRLGWLTPDLKTSPQGDVLYFTGCLPYFDTLFRDIEPNLPDIMHSTVALMNTAGIRPAILADERCCGHDMLWSGDRKTFEKLAKQNIDTINKSGAKTVVFSCPECYRTFRKDYPEILGRDALSGIELYHVSEYLLGLSRSGKLRIGSVGDETREKITFHDPCRLGHHLGVYDAPRELLSAAGDICEMEHNRETAVCCGTSVWVNCDAGSKARQADRLKEAKNAAEKLITACPKCLIHLKCAMKGSDGENLKIDIVDMTMFLGRKVPK